MKTLKKTMQVVTVMAMAAVGVVMMTTDASADRTNWRGQDCYDIDWHMLCKVDGRVKRHWVSTDCGRTRDGDYCRYIYTPGYDQVRVDVRFQCRDGQLKPTHGSNGWCELESDRW